jgi:hypothetical protein
MFLEVPTVGDNPGGEDEASGGAGSGRELDESEGSMCESRGRAELSEELQRANALIGALREEVSSMREQ